MRLFLGIFLLAVAVIAGAYLFFYKQEKRVCIKQQCFFVELAKTDAQRERGLMNRTMLDEGKGMLFIFDEEGVYPFWMKNTLIPLDMVWIDKNNKIVFIAKNVQPCKSLICSTINPNVVAKYVLEINAGICSKLDIKVGDYGIMN